MAGRPKRLVLLDTDVSLGTPGAEIDDGAALIALIAVDALEIAGITTVHGNVDSGSAMHNLQRLLAYMSRTDIALGMGAARPLLADNTWFDAWKDGYGPTPPWPELETARPAADLIVDTIRRHPKQITVLAVGPLTNLAHALRMAPEIVSLVDTLVVMGGSFSSSDPEFNIRCDPEAAQIVLTAGWPVRMLGLDVTRQIVFSRQDFDALPQSNRALDLLRRQAPGWIDRVEGQGWEQGGCALHDAVALAALLDGDLFEWREAVVRVELSDLEQRGSIAVVAAEDTRAPVRVAAGCNAAACFELIWSLLSGVT